MLLPVSSPPRSLPSNASPAVFLWQLQELLRPRGRVVKAFVYIFDVGENMGATSVVPGARSAIARQPFAQNTPLAGKLAKLQGRLRLIPAPRWQVRTDCQAARTCSLANLGTARTPQRERSSRESS